jgi:hypothetical protein
MRKSEPWEYWTQIKTILPEETGGSMANQRHDIHETRETIRGNHSYKTCCLGSSSRHGRTIFMVCYVYLESH